MHQILSKIISHYSKITPYNISLSLSHFSDVDTKAQSAPRAWAHGDGEWGSGYELILESECSHTPEWRKGHSQSLPSGLSPCLGYIQKDSFRREVSPQGLPGSLPLTSCVPSALRMKILRTKRGT